MHLEHGRGGGGPSHGAGGNDTNDLPTSTASNSASAASLEDLREFEAIRDRKLEVRMIETSLMLMEFIPRIMKLALQVQGLC